MGQEAIALATWISVAVLGPGAVAVFIWFVADMTKILAPRRPRRR